MSEPSFAVFDTAIGHCVIVWGDRGVLSVQLPHRDGAASTTRVRQRYANARETAPTPPIRHAIAAITALLRGEPSDLSGINLDMSGVPAFNRQVFEAARGIAPGSTMTYGEIATRLGDPAAARDVGAALGRNPFAIVVPCHRVLAAGGKHGGFSAPGGVATKLRMLSIEGVQLNGTATLFD